MGPPSDRGKLLGRSPSACPGDAGSKNRSELALLVPQVLSKSQRTVRPMAPIGDWALASERRRLRLTRLLGVVVRWDVMRRGDRIGVRRRGLLTVRARAVVRAQLLLVSHAGRAQFFFHQRFGARRRRTPRIGRIEAQSRKGLAMICVVAESQLGANPRRAPSACSGSLVGKYKIRDPAAFAFASTLAGSKFGCFGHNFAVL